MFSFGTVVAIAKWGTLPLCAAVIVFALRHFWGRIEAFLNAFDDKIFSAIEKVSGGRVRVPDEWKQKVDTAVRDAVDSAEKRVLDPKWWRETLRNLPFSSYAGFIEWMPKYLDEMKGELTEEKLDAMLQTIGAKIPEQIRPVVNQAKHIEAERLAEAKIRVEVPAEQRPTQDDLKQRIQANATALKLENKVFVRPKEMQDLVEELRQKNATK